MVPVEVEKDIEVLRQYTLWLQREVAAITKENATLKNAAEAGKQEWLDEKLRDQYSQLQKRFFGSGQESLDRPVGHQEEQLKLHGEHITQEKEKRAQSETLPQVFHYKLSTLGLMQESLLRGITQGAAAWKEVPGLYQEAKEITVREVSYLEIIHRQYKYRLDKKFNKTGKEILITAPGPVKIRPQSKYSVDFAISVAMDKYGFHLPLERQRRKMEEAGFPVEVKTLYGLCEAVAEHCRGVERRIRQDIFQEFSAVHVDESPWPILGSDSNGYMWAISNRRGACYRFEATRSGKVAQEMLNGYEGSVLTDGFAGYNRLKKDPRLRLGACWSHARREFFDRMDDFEEARDAVKIIDKLFVIEAKAKTFEQLRDLRRVESKLVLEEFRQWMFDVASKYLAESGIRKAINYSMNLWQELTRFTEDLSLPLSNNDAERALRHIVMGRKNFNGSKTINGADTAAAIYTVIESAKRVGLQPRTYLKYLIEARWNREEPKTPYELAIEKLGVSTKVIFPKKSEWKV